MKSHCKDRELQKLLLDGGETKSQMVDAINAALTHISNAALPAVTENSTTDALKQRLDTIEAEHQEFRDALKTILGNKKWR